MAGNSGSYPFNGCCEAQAYYAQFFTYYAFEQCSKITYCAQYYTHDCCNYAMVCMQ